MRAGVGLLVVLLIISKFILINSLIEFYLIKYIRLDQFRLTNFIQTNVTKHLYPKPTKKPTINYSINLKNNPTNPK